jgi:hypothetical protein
MARSTTFSLNREARPVAPGWEHPRAGTYGNGSIRYVPLFSRRDMLRHLGEPDMAEQGIDPADYMPEIPEGTPVMWVLYETTTEGTPQSPPFATLGELAAWCELNATTSGSDRASVTQWLRILRDSVKGK